VVGALAAALLGRGGRPRHRPALAQRLVSDGEQVLDVPAKLAAWVRMLSVGHGRKSDPDDAVSVAVAARNAPQLRQVRVEDQAVVLHLLTKRRQDLVAARTQTINRLHRLLLDLVPGGARRNLTANRAAAGLFGPDGVFGAGTLLLADRLFVDANLWRQAAGTGADLVWRTKTNAVLPARPLGTVPAAVAVAGRAVGPSGAAV
jgi:hypothetical protein